MDAPPPLQPAIAQFRAGQLEQSRAMVETILASHPGYAEAWHLLGLVKMRLQLPGEALGHFQTCARLQPITIEVYLPLGQACEALGRWPDAIEAYRAGLALRPHDPALTGRYAMALVRREDWIEGLAQSRNAVAAGNAEPAVILALATALARLHQSGEAQQQLQSLLQRHPYMAEAHAQLAQLFEAANDRPNATRAWFNAAFCHQRENAIDSAIAAYRAALRLTPEHASAAYLLGSLTARTPLTAPREYVVDLFDRYADHFDRHLQDLGYRVPQQLRELVETQSGPAGPAKLMLDLGCGTGACARAFQGYARTIIGVDLAPRMVAASRQTECYREVHQAEATEFLRQSTEFYDLIVAADLFIYVGDLDELFRAVSARCTRDARFAFSVEDAPGPSYVLRPSGRFAHSLDYLHALARLHGYRVERTVPTCIRMGLGEAIPGHLLLLRPHERLKDEP